jgi:hypothetical protein
MAFFDILFFHEPLDLGIVAGIVLLLPPVKAQKKIEYNYVNITYIACMGQIPLDDSVQFFLHLDRCAELYVLRSILFLFIFSK